MIFTYPEDTLPTKETYVASSSRSERDSGEYTYICDTRSDVYPEIKDLKKDFSFFDAQRKKQWRKEQFK